MRSSLRAVLIVVMLMSLAVLLGGCGGVNIGNLSGLVTDALRYNAAVSASMEAKGWDFPGDPISSARYWYDLGVSVKDAIASGGMSMVELASVTKTVCEFSSLGADAARPLPQVMPPDGRGLAEAFGVAGHRGP